MTKKNGLRVMIVSILCIVTIHVGAQNADIDLLKSINPNPPSSGFWKAASGSAYPLSIGAPVALTIYGLLNKNDRTEYAGLKAIGSLAAAVVVTEALKVAIDRPRPYIKYPLDIHPNDASETGQSFPSAHTSLAFATATSLSLDYRKWYVAVPAFGWATLVGYSRLYLGEHYPTDVLAGAAVGAGSAVLAHWLSKKILRKVRH